MESTCSLTALGMSLVSSSAMIESLGYFSRMAVVSIIWDAISAAKGKRHQAPVTGDLSSL